MNNQTISFEDVILIRKNNRNPDVTFAPNLKYKDLKNINYKTMVGIFKDRLNGWYFNAGGQLSEKHKEIGGSNFVAMILDCVIIDLLSQYYYGLEVSNGSKFIKFFRENLAICNHRLNKPIESCNYYEYGGGWKRIIIKETAEAVFYGFRCGLIHSGRILEYGRINELYLEPIVIKEWDSDKNKYDVHINPALLLKEIKKAFEIYVEKLLGSRDTVLKNNFIKKIRLDYGIDLSDK